MQNVVTALVLGVRLPEPALVAALVAGTVTGMALANRMSAASVRRLVLAVSCVGGLGLVGGVL